MKWKDDYNIGIPTIDSQHKRLFKLINQLNDSLRAGLKGADVEKLFVSLDQYKTRHFQLEERYMEECKYPGLSEQQSAHAFFMKRFKELGDELKQTGMTPAIVQAIKSELSEWLSQHVTGLDMDFGRYYQQQEKSR